jgi:hypothetical protein
MGIGFDPIANGTPPHTPVFGLKESHVSNEFVRAELAKLKCELIWSMIAVVGIFDTVLW